MGPQPFQNLLECWSDLNASLNEPAWCFWDRPAEKPWLWFRIKTLTQRTSKSTCDKSLKGLSRKLKLSSFPYFPGKRSVFLLVLNCWSATYPIAANIGESIPAKTTEAIDTVTKPATNICGWMRSKMIWRSSCFSDSAFATSTGTI